MDAKDLNYYTLKAPVKQIDEAVKVAAEMAEEYKAHQERRSALNFKEYSGRDEKEIKQKRDADVAALDAEWGAKVDEAQERIAELGKEAHEFIDEQVMPKGSDITGGNEGDFKLLEHGLIDTPDKLQMLLEGHQDASFRVMARKYADERGWNGFQGLDKEESLREYVSEYMKMAGLACSVPNGMKAMQAVDPKEPRRMAEAYGVDDCYLTGKQA